MNSSRLLASIALFLLAVVAGLFLSGYLALLLLKLDTGLLSFGTYLDYLRHLDHPKVQIHAFRIKAAGLLGFGIPLVFWLGASYLIFRARPQGDLHGKARFASLRDLAARGFFRQPSDGIVVGKKNGRLLRLGGQQFAILAAPTRSGKGVGIVIPNLLDYRESAVVLDIKQENFDLTSGWRRSIGHEIYLFNPFAEDRRTHRWNPMSYVSRDPAFRISDLQAIAAMLYPDVDDKDKFWVSQARNAFLAFALYLFEQADHQPEADRPTLGALLRLSSGSGDGDELKPYLQQLSQASFLGTQARTAFAGLLSQADETFASIIGSFREPLNPWLNPVLDAATGDDDFRLDDVRRRRMTIYVGIQPNKLAESRLIVNLFFSQLINANTRVLPQNDASLKHQCLLLMDEFTAIGKVDILAKAVAYMAGYNLRLLPIVQSMAQLDAVYGKELSRTLITNHALQIIYAPREQQDANDYSEMLGYTTLRRQSRTRSRGQGSSVSDNEVFERRALMLPQELKAMGPDKQILLYEGMAHPVMCQKIRYYRDRHFTRRLMDKVAIPPLQLPGDASMSGKTTAVIAASTLALLSACASPQGHASAESTRASLDAPAAQAVHAAPAVPTGHSPDEDLRVQPRQDHVPPEYRCAPIALDRARLDEIAAERAFFGGLVDQMVADGELPPPSGRTRVRTDEPVTEWLGPQRFVIPVNFYKSQSGPANHAPAEGRGAAVDLSVQWPCLEPMPPGVVASEHQALVRRAINITLSYVNPAKVSLEELMRFWISPINPDDPVQRTNPVDNLDLRLQGEPLHGLTPYYVDLARMTAYSKTHYPSASSRESILRKSDEWYLHQGDAGYPTTIIKCPSREIPDGLLVRGNEVFENPPHRRLLLCDHRFVIPEWHLDVSVSYPRVFLPHWRRIEDRVRALLRAGHAP